MARIFVGKIYCNDRFKILTEFFICLISYSDLFFGKIICKLYHNNSVKIYIDISSNPPSPLVEKHRFLGNPPSPPVRLRRKWMTPYVIITAAMSEYAQKQVLHCIVVVASLWQ